MRLAEKRRYMSKTKLHYIMRYKVTLILLLAFTILSQFHLAVAKEEVAEVVVFAETLKYSRFHMDGTDWYFNGYATTIKILNNKKLASTTIRLLHDNEKPKESFWVIPGSKFRFTVTRSTFESWEKFPQKTFHVHSEFIKPLRSKL